MAVLRTGKCSRRTSLKALALGAAVHSGSSSEASARSIKYENTTRPNILYIHSHDTGRYVRPYGYDVDTPVINRLAGEGVMFRHYFTANPTCSASRASLLTGRYPHSNGMIGLAHRGFALNDYNHHIVNTLKAHGYYTALAGIQHVAHGSDPWRTIGYDDYLGPHKDAHTSAATFLEKAPSQPFFLSVGFFETHRKFHEPPPHIDPGNCNPPAPLPDTQETRSDMAAFKASTEVLDQKMGTVLDALDRAGLTGKTLVICTTDHGIAFPRMKCNLTDSGIGIMLIMRGPGGFSGGRVIDGLSSTIDIFPTICDILDIEHPGWLQGTSLMPLVTGELKEIRDVIHAEVNYHAAYEPKRCVRTHRWKYIMRYDSRDRPVLPNCDDGPSKTVWLQHGWGERNVPEEALYDLVFDPGETDNLAGDANYATVLADMRGRMQNWMRETDDPLLHGPVRAPADARVNDPDGVSPGEKTGPPEYIQ